MADESPYTLDATDNPRLLATRRAEIEWGVSAISGSGAARKHALVLGERRMGRTSTVNAIARRVARERNALVVRLALTEDELTTSGLARAVLTATIEKLQEGSEVWDRWYVAWCNRVYLRDRQPISTDDELVSGLVYSNDPRGIVEPAVLRRDLATLQRKASEKGYEQVVLVLDDADALFEDDDLTQRLLADLDATSGGWSLLASTLHAGLKHLVESVSPCLQRMELVP